MQKREKILAIVLASALGVFVVVPKIWAWFNGPAEELQNQLNIAKTSYEKKDLELTQTLAKQMRMKDWKCRSLSPKPQEAALQYQQWLTDLAEVVAEFSNVQVVPEASAAAANQPYVAVRFRLRGEATLAQVRLFLFRLLQADLLHGVTLIGLDSPSAQGNPRLAVNMQFEALSLRDAPPRGPSLFPRTEVLEDWTGPKRPLRVRSAEGFPAQAPFTVRAGRDYFAVKKVSGSNWTVEPDPSSPRTMSSSALALSEGDTLELVQIHPDFAKHSLSTFDPILTKNPFLKPVPYAPRMEFVGSKSVSRGGSLDLTIKATGFDYALGDPKFEMDGEIPEGLTLDPRTGRMTWQPSSEQSLGDNSIKVTATAPGLKAPLTSPLILTLKQTNKSPTIYTSGERSAVLGREFVLQIQAKDEDSDDKLKYALGNGAPEGAKIDAATGVLKWTPPSTLVPGPVKVTIQVTDLGSPPATTSKELTINVGDDVALFTVLTGIVTKDGRKEIWLSDKSTNKRLVLHEGETLRYADIDAKVERIEAKSVFLRKDETAWRLDLGETLKNMKKQDPPAAAAPAGAASDKTPATESTSEKPATAAPASDR